MGIMITPLNTDKRNIIVDELNNSADFALLVAEITKYQDVTETEKTDSFEFTFLFPEQEKEVKKEALFVTLNDETIVEAVRESCGKLRIKAHYSAILETGEKVTRQAVVSDRSVVNELEIPFDERYFQFVEHLKHPTGAEEINAEDVSTQAWYEGCLVFGDPATGFHHYKWCGAKCGSGTPINALDRCCRAHDYCWANFGKGDDECDMNLYHCASKTSDPGWYMVATFGYECATSGLFGVC
ncbi:MULTISPECIES: hypothetical protein [Bacillus]|uniref:hypothetical protein n=1 Tax=Bacillus TaxID=1386 RepID=UPI000407D0AF|nr:MULTISPECIES: hypothetical protein [Bacillus]QHZ48339.1 hypothetical protein M654_019700 [Bacillus sp. NSP9.1]WFA05998.1 hypothetical protein P3X63_04050 [Bacillus sp. HSf4]